MCSNEVLRKYSIIIKMFKRIFSILIIITTLLSLGACSSNNQKNEQSKYDTLESLSKQTAAVFVGSVYDELISEYVDDPKLEYYQSAAECIGAVVEGKADFTVNEKGPAILSVKQNPELSLLPYEIGNYQYGAIFNQDRKGFTLKTEFNEYIKQNYSQDDLLNLYNEYLINDAGKAIDYESLPNINGNLTIASDGVNYPLTYIREGKFTGFEIELIYNFCKAKGYSMKIAQYDFGGVLAAISFGKADIGMSSIIITEERQKSYYFSDPYASGTSYIIIRKVNSITKYSNVIELTGKSIGVLAGSINDHYAKNTISNVDIQYFNSMSDIIKSIISEKVEAGVASDAVFDSKLAENNGVISIGTIASEQLAFAIAKNNKCSLIKYDLDEYINKIKESGELQEIIDKWFSDDEDAKDIDYSGLEDINGTIKLAVSSDSGAPSCYYKDNKIVGLDIDIIVSFAKEYGYNIEMEDYSFAGMLTAVSSGICDVAASNITITEERKENMQFSEYFYDGKIIVLVKKQDNVANKNNIFTNLTTSFKRTLIEENRYQLYIDGIIVTASITFAAAIMGLILGFILFSLYRGNYFITNKLLKYYEWIVNGLPAVVVLMVFYYIIFADSNLNGIWIAIISFTVIFSTSIFGLIKNAAMAIDKGQYEAAYALGYNKKKTIRYIIIPQIMPLFLSPFKAELISLVKATSVVGYIAVQDITKISDIIRSRTYEAFFPLIITTIIYFVMVSLFTVLISFLEKKLNPKNRNIDDILKGAK